MCGRKGKEKLFSTSHQQMMSTRCWERRALVYLAVDLEDKHLNHEPPIPLPLSFYC